MLLFDVTNVEDQMRVNDLGLKFEKGPGGCLKFAICTSSDIFRKHRKALP